MLLSFLLLLFGVSQGMIMRNVNGECIVKFCWDGSKVDSFDCWCPDPPPDPDAEELAPIEEEIIPPCTQKKCWDDSEPNIYDCTCPARPPKNVTDHTSPTYNPN
jgi:hypothetical protein